MLTGRNSVAGRCLPLIAVCFFLFSANVFSENSYEEYFLYWKYSSNVIINTSSAGLGNDVSSFPLLVRLTNSNFTFANAKPDGSDIRFMTADGTPLDYDIERWDSGNDLAEIWVLVDTVFRNNSSQFVKMYWGNTNATSADNPEAVFATGNDFAAVWHLNEDPSGTGAVIIDRTANSNDGDPGGSMTSGDLVNAVVGKGIDFNGGLDSNDYISAGSNSSLDNLSSLTIEAWIYPQSWGGNNYGRIISKTNSTLAGMSFMMCNNNAIYGLETFGFMRDRTGLDTSDARAANSSLNLNTWYHVVMVLANNISRLYINGSQPSSYVRQLTGSSTLFSDASYNFFIGNSSGTGTYNRPFDGVMDEIRVSNAVRDSNWIKLSYQIQRSGQTVVTVGSASSAALIRTHPQSDTVIVGDAVAIAVDAIGSPAPTYHWQKYSSGTWGDYADTDSILSITPAAVTDSGYYRAIASNTGGHDTSNSAYLFVISNAPMITTHPQSDTVHVGAAASLWVAAVGNPAPQYKWLKNGTELIGETDSIYSVAIASFASAGVFRGIAENSLGSDTSNEAHLVVYDSTNIITQHPVSDTLLAGQEARFLVVAAGGGLTYQWQKNAGTWADTAGATTDTLKFTAQSGDDGNYYRCIVSSGPVKDTSNDYGVPQAMLYIATVPIITSTFPTDTAIGVGGTMTFTAAATAKPPAEYYWYLKPTPTADSIPVDTGAVLTLSNVTKGDRGQYFFVADNRYGKVTSSRVMLHVVDNVAIITNLSEKHFVINGGEAVFSPDFSGEGTISYQWYENGAAISGQITSSLSINPVDSAQHDGKAYSCLASNTYLNVLISTVTTRACTLVVSRYYNPFKVKAERIDIHNTTQVRIKLWSDVDLTNFPTTDPVLPPAPWADSLWVLYTTKGFPTGTQQTNVVKVMYSTDEIKNAPDTVEKTLDVTELNPGGLLPFVHDSCYWFNFSVRWRDPVLSNDTLLKPLTEANKVFMIDSLAPPNPLVVHGEYIMKTDTALVVIDSINKLNPAEDSLVVVKCSMYPGLESPILDTTVPVAVLIASGTSDTIVLDSVGKLPLELDTVYCQWYIIGKNTATGIKSDAMFTIGWPRPVYPGKLRADSTYTGDKMHLSWDAPAGGADSVRIWWDTVAIPLHYDIQLSIDQAHYVNPPTLTIDTVVDLSNDRVYHFGLQIFRDEMWSYVTDSSSASAKTSLGDTTRIPNIISIDSTWFNDTTNSMVIHWHLNFDSIPAGKKAKMGFTFTLDSILDTATTAAPFKWDSVVQEVNVTSIPLYPKIVFDTVYTVGLWLRGVSLAVGQGEPSPPTDSSTITVRIPFFTWEEIILFPDTIDTVFAVNQKIIFKKLVTNTIKDTVWAFTSVVIPPGFVQVGGVYFKLGNNPIEVPPMIMGLRYDSIPAGVTENDLRMYQYINNNIHVRHKSWPADSAVWDTVRKEDLAYPFLILADTMNPAITITTPYNDTIIPGGSNIPTYFGISDNCANVYWEFLFGPGHEGYGYNDTGYLDTPVDTTLKSFILNQTSVVNTSFGVRALIIASDGIRADTINVSRLVKTDATEIISVIAHEWVPLRTATNLDVPALGTVFTSSITSPESWEYDIYDYRLYRWYDNADAGENDWLEYSDAVKDLFSFVPSRLIWFKSAENQVISFGSGVTTSLKEPYEIVLKPRNWTDVTLPYQFNVMFRDILETTGLAQSDCLEIYHWKKAGKVYEAVEKYIASLDSIVDVIDTMKSQQKNDGYTIYNHSQSPITLRIPPTCLALSDYAGAKKREHTGSEHAWNIHFMWKDCAAGKDAFYRRIRCGYRRSKSKAHQFGFLPPTMSSVHVGIVDKSKGKLCGWSLQPSLKDGGISFEVRFNNTGIAKTEIEYYLDNLLVLPKGFKAKMLDPKTHTYQDCTPGTHLKIAVGEKGSTGRIIVIGTDNYMKSLIKGYLPMKFVKAYPNPFNGRIRIHYRIPFGITEVQFTLYNLRGQQLWKGIDRKHLTPGDHILQFDGKTNLKSGILPAGVYIMRMTAKNKAGKVIYGGKKRLTCLK